MEFTSIVLAHGCLYAVRGSARMTTTLGGTWIVRDHGRVIAWSRDGLSWKGTFPGARSSNGITWN